MLLQFKISMRLEKFNYIMIFLLNITVFIILNSNKFFIILNHFLNKFIRKKNWKI